MGNIQQSFLYQLIFAGKIPAGLLNFGKKVLLFSSLVPLLGIFFLPADFRNLGKFAWGLLILILVLRPLGDIFVDFKILKALLPLRKEAGILCGSLAIGHSIGYFFNGKIAVSTIFTNPALWDFSQYLAWGLVGFFVSVLLVLTSNLLSIKILKRNWKRLHRITYIMFLVTAIHVVLIKYSKAGIFFSPEVLQVFVPVIGVFVLWILSALQVKISFSSFFSRKK